VLAEDAAYGLLARSASDKSIGTDARWRNEPSVAGFRSLMNPCRASQATVIQNQLRSPPRRGQCGR
jgi:hypothetical protein